MKPVCQVLRGEFADVVGEQHVIPAQMFDRQGCRSEGDRDRLEGKNASGLKLHDHALTVVPDEVGAIEPPEKVAVVELELHLGSALRAVAPLVLGKRQELLDVVIAYVGDEGDGVHDTKLPRLLHVARGIPAIERQRPDAFLHRAFAGRCPPAPRTLAST
jgi:hypothetical protein